MARRADVEAELERLKKENLTLSQAHARSIELAGKIRDTYPNTWQAEAKKNYVYIVIVELIKELKNGL